MIKKDSEAISSLSLDKDLTDTKKDLNLPLSNLRFVIDISESDSRGDCSK